ncbi:MAG: hypothetical protein D6676_08860 [Cyanobacteria bacterium J003]|nr:MAG: hypothetical protein D6676_08860 [Cyanobacteria bacterium J003]
MTSWSHPQQGSTNLRLWTTADDRLDQVGLDQLRQTIDRSRVPKPGNTAQTRGQFRWPLGVPCSVQ